MTVMYTPLTDAQKEKLSKLAKGFVRIATKPLTPNSFVDFQKELGKIDRLFKRENLSLIRVDFDGSLRVVAPEHYLWRHENPSNYRALKYHAEYFSRFIPHLVKGDMGDIAGTLQ